MPITYKAPFVPDYPTEEDRVTEVGPMFEAATSTNLPTDGVPLGATQPSVAPGPSVPPAGGPGTITYGETVVKPKHYAGDANQPLPWWYNEMLAKEEARKDQEKAAQREMDARYWAEQEFKRRTGNLVPKTMEEATRASMEMRRIESQLGLQYDINAGVPIEKALAKWGGNLSPGVGAYGRFGTFGGLAGMGFSPKAVNVGGADLVETRPGVYQQIRKSLPPEQLFKPLEATLPSGEKVEGIQTGKGSTKIIEQPKEPLTVSRPILKPDAKGDIVQAGTERLTARQNQIRDLEEKKNELIASKQKARASKQTEIDQQIQEASDRITKLENAKMVTNQSQYNALKSGDIYISKDGSVRVKP